MRGAISIRTSLTRFHSDRRDMERVAREGWHETGIAAINVNDPRLDDWERQAIKNIANKLYGERR